MSACRLPSIRLTICSLYVLPGSNSCASQSRITTRLAAATGIDCRRPSTTNARSTLRASSGASSNSVDRRSGVGLPRGAVWKTSPAHGRGRRRDCTIKPASTSRAQRLGDLRRSEPGRGNDLVDVRRAELDGGDHPAPMAVGEQPDQRGRVEVGQRSVPEVGIDRAVQWLALGEAADVGRDPLGQQRLFHLQRRRRCAA